MIYGKSSMEKEGQNGAWRLPLPDHQDLSRGCLTFGSEAVGVVSSYEKRQRDKAGHGIE